MVLFIMVYRNEEASSTVFHSEESVKDNIKEGSDGSKKSRSKDNNSGQSTHRQRGPQGFKQVFAAKKYFFESNILKIEFISQIKLMETLSSKFTKPYILKISLFQTPNLKTNKLFFYTAQGSSFYLKSPLNSSRPLTLPIPPIQQLLLSCQHVFLGHELQQFTTL